MQLRIIKILPINKVMVGIYNKYMRFDKYKLRKKLKTGRRIIPFSTVQQMRIDKEQNNMTASNIALKYDISYHYTCHILNYTFRVFE